MTSAVQALQRPMQRDSFALFFFFSLLLHAFLLVFFSTLQLPSMKPPTERFLKIKLLPPSSQPTPPVIAKVEPPQAAAPLQVQKPQPVEKPKLLEEAKPKLLEAKPQEKLPEQIVNPPDQSNDQIPEKTRLLSDRNSAAKEESVARGLPRPASPQKEQPPVKEKTQKEQEKPPVQTAMKPSEPSSPIDKPAKKLEGELAPPKRPAPRTPEGTKREPVQTAMRRRVVPTLPEATFERKIEKSIADDLHTQGTPSATAEAAKRAPKLFVRPEELLSQGWISDEGKDREEKENRQPPQGRDLIAMAPPPAENLFALSGPIGTPDVLPDIRQGNITFLNAKANRFAPFVRRVALRVFQHLIIHQRKNLHIDDVVAAHDFSTIEAKIDTHGNLKKLAIHTRSGSYAVDEALLRACENGAWDENPPSEAIAEDGLIHFIFRSELNAQFDQLGLRAILTTLQVGLV